MMFLIVPSNFEQFIPRNRSGSSFILLENYIGKSIIFMGRSNLQTFLIKILNCVNSFYWQCIANPFIHRNVTWY